MDPIGPDHSGIPADGAVGWLEKGVDASRLKARLVLVAVVGLAYGVDGSCRPYDEIVGSATKTPIKAMYVRPPRRQLLQPKVVGKVNASQKRAKAWCADS